MSDFHATLAKIIVPFQVKNESFLATNSSEDNHFGFMVVSLARLNDPSIPLDC